MQRIHASFRALGTISRSGIRNVLLLKNFTHRFLIFTIDPLTFRIPLISIAKIFLTIPFYFFLYRENVSRMYVREGGELSMKLKVEQKRTALIAETFSITCRVSLILNDSCDSFRIKGSFRVAFRKFRDYFFFFSPFESLTTIEIFNYLAYFFFFLFFFPFFSSVSLFFFFPSFYFNRKKR